MLLSGDIAPLTAEATIRLPQAAFVSVLYEPRTGVNGDYRHDLLGKPLGAGWANPAPIPEEATMSSSFEDHFNSLNFFLANSLPTAAAFSYHSRACFLFTCTPRPFS